MTISRVDCAGNTVTSFSGPVTLTFSGLATAPSGAVPTVANSGGTAVNEGTSETIQFANGVSVTTAGQGILVAYDEQGPVTLNVTDGTLSSASTGGLSLTVSAATASQLAFVQEPPSSVTADATMSPAVTVEATDLYDNPVGGASVTMSLNGTGALTGGGAQITAAGTGIATFSGLSVNTIGVNKTLTATVSSPSLTANSSPFNVVLGSIASYSVSAGTTQTRGVAFNVTVTALDAGGNVVTTDNSTAVTMTSSTGNVQFTPNPGTPTSGTFTVGAVDDYFETLTITATDANSITGTSASITINPASGDFRSQVTGNWATAGTWQTWSGTAWVTARTAPPNLTEEINVQGGFTVTVAASALVPNSLFVVNSGSTVSISGSQTLTVGNGVANGLISGSGILAESGTGNTLALTGNNTYSGGTTITGGIVSVTNVATPGNAKSRTARLTFASGGTLLYNYYHRFAWADLRPGDHAQ